MKINKILLLLAIVIITACATWLTWSLTTRTKTVPVEGQTTENNEPAKVVFFNTAVNRYNKEKTNTYKGFVELYRYAYEQSYDKMKAPEKEKAGINKEIQYLESMTDPELQKAKLKEFKQINKVNSFFAGLASTDYKASKMVEGFLKAQKQRNS